VEALFEANRAVGAAKKMVVLFAFCLFLFLV